LFSLDLFRPCFFSFVFFSFLRRAGCGFWLRGFRVGCLFQFFESVGVFDVEFGDGGAAQGFQMAAAA
jgi:hypothetical protein